MYNCEQTFFKMGKETFESISLQIEGEMGKFNTLPVDVLVEIAKRLQTLVQTIAKTEIPDSTSIVDLNNFKLELAGFYHGSAVPQFTFTNRVQTTVGSEFSTHRQKVSSKLREILVVANSGKYSDLKKLYPEAAIRNEVVTDLFNFTNSFNSSPVTVVDVKKEKSKVIITPLYKIKKFSKDSKDDLMVEIKKDSSIIESESITLKKVKKTISRGKKASNKVLEEYSLDQVSVAYTTSKIVVGEKVYNLKFPLRCSLEKEDDYFTISNDFIDIIGTGRSVEEAEESFAEEFDYIYNRYNELEESEMSTRLNLIKLIINSIVKTII